jgi:hypothetical protein
MLRESVTHTNGCYQRRLSEAFVLQLKRVSKFHDKNFAGDQLKLACKLEGIERDELLSNARISLQLLSTRSGPFLNISKGDAVQMKKLIDTHFFRPTTKKTHPISAERIISIAEERIEIEEATMATEESTWYMKLIYLIVVIVISQISNILFPSFIKDKFLESDEDGSFSHYAECLLEFNSLIKVETSGKLSSDSYFIEKVKILTEKKRIRELAANKSQRKKELKVTKEEIERNFNCYSKSLELMNELKEIKEKLQKLEEAKEKKQIRRRQKEDNDSLIMKSLQDKEEAKVLKRAEQKVAMKKHHKTIAAQAISRKKGCRGNNAGDGPADNGSVGKKSAGTCIQIFICIYVYVYMY